VPALSATAGNNTANLSWSGSSGSYDVYRNETGCNAGFTKVRNDNTTSTYADTAVANGFTYTTRSSPTSAQRGGCRRRRPASR
jgi:hypothetical protein